MSNNKIIASYNGKDSYLDQLVIPVNDRAYLFGDAVYEVIRIYHGKPFLMNFHMERLQKSLGALGISVPDQTPHILDNVLKNHITDGMVYLQVSRGCAPRAHSFHQLDLKPNVLIYAQTFSEPPYNTLVTSGAKAITHEDLRSNHCNIKTVNLLANCLAQTKANEHGALEAILIRDGKVTEATASNVFIVKDGTVKTPRLSTAILPGTRRRFLVEQLTAAGHPVSECDITRSELFAADEIFVTSTTKEAIGIVALDDKDIGNKTVGPITKLARDLIIKNASC